VHVFLSLVTITLPGSSWRYWNEEQCGLEDHLPPLPIGKTINETLRIAYRPACKAACRREWPHRWRIIAQRVCPNRYGNIWKVGELKLLGTCHLLYKAGKHTFFPSVSISKFNRVSFTSMPSILKVKIINARDLPVMDRSTDLTDAFVEIRFGSLDPHRTAIARRTLSPVWNEVSFHKYLTYRTFGSK
jgi:hypothetical protein